MCTAVDVKKKKVSVRCRTYLCITRQYVAEYSGKMDVSVEQHCEIKFCVRLKKTASKTTALLKQAFGKKMLGDSTNRQWHKAFVDRQESAEFKMQGAALQKVVTVTNIKTVPIVIKEDRHLTA